jgi:hypothetical protein
MLVTLLSLRNQAKDRADMEDADFVEDSNWNIYANYALAELYDLIIDTDDTCVVKSATMPAVTGQSSYALPGDFYKISRIYEKQADDKLLSMDSMSAHDLSQPYLYDEIWRSTRGDSRYRYYLEGLNIEIKPVPSGVFDIFLKYIPQFTPLVNDASTVNYPIVAGWEEYVVVGMAMRALAKEGTPTQQLAAERSTYVERIRQMTSGKDRFSPRRIRDVYGSSRRNYRYNSTQR